MLNYDHHDILLITAVQLSHRLTTLIYGIGLGNTRSPSWTIGAVSLDHSGWPLTTHDSFWLIIYKIRTTINKLFLTTINQCKWDKFYCQLFISNNPKITQCFPRETEGRHMRLALGSVALQVIDYHKPSARNLLSIINQLINQLKKSAC